MTGVSESSFASLAVHPSAAFAGLEPDGDSVEDLEPYPVPEAANESDSDSDDTEEPLEPKPRDVDVVLRLIEFRPEIIEGSHAYCYNTRALE